MNTSPFAQKRHRNHRVLSASQATTTTQTVGSAHGTRRAKRTTPAVATRPNYSHESDSALRQRALGAAQLHYFSEAIALFTELIRRNPLNANDYNNRGLVYYKNKQLDAAIADYNRALELNPNLDSAYNNRANYYAAQGQFLEAILDYDTAIDLNPTNVRARINQGITFRDLELYPQAIECFDLALCFGNLEEHIYAERGRAYYLSGDWNCAVADYQRSLQCLEAQSEQRSLRLSAQVERWLNEVLEPLKSPM